MEKRKEYDKSKKNYPLFPLITGIVFFLCAIFFVILLLCVPKQPKQKDDRLLWSAAAAFLDYQTSYEAAKPKSDKQPTLKYGQKIGTLSIPDNDLTVTLYYGNCKNKEQLSSIADHPDKAVCWMGHPKTDFCVIADHNDQAFAALPYTTAGTKATIQNADGTITNLQCMQTLDGQNQTESTPYDIVDNEGTPVYERGDIIMYTCLEDSSHIFITIWNRIDK